MREEILRIANIRVNIASTPADYSIQSIEQYRNVFKLMDVSSANVSDEPFHSPASFNATSIVGIHFAYISCC